MENRAEHLMELYFSNTISKTDLLELQDLIANDPEVSAEMEFQKRLSGSLKRLSLADGIQNKAWRDAAVNSFPAKAIRVNMWSKYAYALAATFALVIAAYLFILRPPSLQSITADNFKEYPITMGYKSLGDGTDDLPAGAKEAFDLYDDKSFGRAAKAFEPVVAANADRLDIRFYWGVALLADKQYGAAYTALNPVVQNANSEFHAPALYYLGLACAGKGDKNCARQNLEAYKTSDSVTFRKQAQKVLDAL